jgi:heterodisulfide reductase subunit C2
MNTFDFENCNETFIRKVETRSGQDLSLCYQCGNCTAGCPYTFAYDIPANRIMRLLQTGRKKEVLSCRSIWLCGTCYSCTTRCPNNIDVAGIMDHLRHMAREEGFATEKNVKIFCDQFLKSVERNGRVFEMGLMASYVMNTGRFLTDFEIAPQAMLKGKLHFKPPAIKGRAHVADIFKRFREKNLL